MLQMILTTRIATFAVLMHLFIYCNMYISLQTFPPDAVLVCLYLVLSIGL